MTEPNGLELAGPLHPRLLGQSPPWSQCESNEQARHAGGEGKGDDKRREAEHARDSDQPNMIRRASRVSCSSADPQFRSTLREGPTGK